MSQPRTVVIGIRVPRETADAWAIEAAERGIKVSTLARNRALRGEPPIVVPRGRPGPIPEIPVQEIVNTG